MSHDHSAAAGREPQDAWGRMVLDLIANDLFLAYHQDAKYRSAKVVAGPHRAAIEAEAIATERSRVRLLMEQGSGDGLEDGTYCLPIAVANEILEPK